MFRSADGSNNNDAFREVCHRSSLGALRRRTLFAAGKNRPHSNSTQSGKQAASMLGVRKVFSTVATAASTAVASPAAKSVFAKASSIPARYPLAFGVIFSGCKTSFSDLLVQKVVERREKVDWRRNAAFATFGFFYLGGVQYALYVPIFSRLFPNAASFARKPLAQKFKDTKGIVAMLAQTFIDQCIHHPLMYFPVFYCTKELVVSNGQPDFRRCLEEYRNNMSEDLQALWKIWVPATLINFSFMPMHLRIPFVAGVSLLWTCILSTMRGGDVGHADELVGGAVTGASLHVMEEALHEAGGLFTQTVNLDASKSHIVLTASGLDKPGWVALLSRAVSDAGGSVTESKMVRLGDEFIVLMHVAVDPSEAQKLVKYVQKQQTLNDLTIHSKTISRRKTGTYQVPMTGVRLRCVGADKPGLLASISESLFAVGLSVEHVHTSLRPGKGGRLDFVSEIDCVATTYMDQDEMREMVYNLGRLKELHDLDICDVRVQRLRVPEA